MKVYLEEIRGSVRILAKFKKFYDSFEKTFENLDNIMIKSFMNF